MKFRLLLATLAVLIGGWPSVPAAADVVVLENRTDGKVVLAVRQADGKEGACSIPAGDVLPIPAPGPVHVAFMVDGQPRRYALAPNGIHYFMNRDKKLDLFQLPLPAAGNAGPPAVSKEKPPDPSVEAVPALQPAGPLCVIPVMILCDDSEPRVRSLWEKQIRRRMADASDIFEHHCRVRFQVTAVGSWDSEKNIRDFEKSLAEFERKVRPAPARLAIGFTGRYKWEPGEKHLGGTYGPLHSHILVREALRNVSEPERLEVLVHELGHFLGAVHTPDRDSVMRPILGDQRSRLRGFRIGFDAPNTLAMYLLAEELRRRPIVSLCQLPADSKTPMRGVYSMLAKALPDDRAAPMYLAMLDFPPRIAAQPPDHMQGLTAGTRSAMRAIVQAAGQNQRLPERKGESPAGPHRLTGDELTDCYVRAAATAAKGLPPKTAEQAFLLALGIALDDSSLLRDAPPTSYLWRQIEPDAERRARLAVLGAPTMRGRHDLAQHFCVSAALVVVTGAQGAEMAGILKEVSDAHGGSGFSFLDLSADLAGVTFAMAIHDGKLHLASLGTSFKVQDFMPELTGLKEGFSWKDIVENYGGLTGERFRGEVTGIRRRTLALPGYKGVAAGKRPGQS